MEVRLNNTITLSDDALMFKLAVLDFDNEWSKNSIPDEIRS